MDNKAVLVLSLIPIMALFMVPLPAQGQYNDPELMPLIHQDRNNSKITKKTKK